MYEKRQKSLFLLGPGGCSPTEDVLIYVQIQKLRKTDSFSDSFREGEVEKLTKEFKI